jgi:hypothetical protein
MGPHFVDKISIETLFLKKRRSFGVDPDTAGGTSLFSSDVDPLLLRGRQELTLLAAWPT